MIDEILNLIKKEYYDSNVKFGLYNSTHEGYAVILEELDEMWDEIKSNDLKRAKEEAIQVASTALKFLMSF